MLYSDTYSHPSKPVNILVSLLILKQLPNLTDEELLASLYFDYSFQYALGIEDFDKERICINLLTNFRQRLVKHEVATGQDLLKDEFDYLSARLADLIQLDKSMARIRLVRALAKQEITPIPENFLDYLKETHENQILYHAKNS